MKIVIGCRDICGLVHTLGEGYRALGHKVKTISNKHQFYDHNYTIRLEKEHFLEDMLCGVKHMPRFIAQFLARRIQAPPKEGEKSNQRQRRVQREKRVLQGLRSSLIDWCDTYIQIVRSFGDEEQVLSELKGKGKRIITLFLGSEVRDYKLFVEKYDAGTFQLEERLFKTTERNLKKLRLHEEYASNIFSVPDQSLRAARPYHHILLPFKIEEYSYAPTANAIPSVLHCPSDSNLKGTRIIERAIRELSAEGLEFEYTFLTGVPHREVCKALEASDIVVDQIVLPGPGFLGYEAMLKGCLVLGRTDPDSLVRPPVVSVTKDTLKEKLRYWIEHADERRNRIQEARRYVEENHHISKICEYYLSPDDRMLYQPGIEGIILG